jgi:hypothetical protein
MHTNVMVAEREKLPRLSGARPGRRGLGRFGLRCSALGEAQADLMVAARDQYARGLTPVAQPGVQLARRLLTLRRIRLGCERTVGRLVASAIS